jgi:hypothetical protein
MSHTPGPWAVYPETDGTAICAVDWTEGLPIRQFIARPERGPNWIANAQLIAAAPDMLKALVKARSHPMVHLPIELEAMINAAISKAEGK